MTRETRRKKGGPILWIVAIAFGFLCLTGDWDGDGFDARNPKPRAARPPDPCAGNARFERVHAAGAPYPTWFLADGFGRAAFTDAQDVRALERLYREHGQTVVYAEELGLCD